MHRHTHSVCMNLTYDSVERRLKAAQFGDLKRDAPYWEAVFEARLAHKLEGLGYAIDRQAIIDGLRRYPYVLLDLRRFCLMREGSEVQRELLGELEAHGLTRAADIAPAADSAFVLLRNDAGTARRRVASWLKLPWRSRAPGLDAPGRP